MNCDRIAPFYRAFELAAFGRQLERHRFYFLEQVHESRRALLLGEGDGRFLSRLLKISPHVEVDCVDLSAGMLGCAKGRLGADELQRVRFIHADALSLDLPSATYDLVVTNFVFDCFDEPELNNLVNSIRKACRPGAQWVVTEFQQLNRGWPALHSALWLKSMYVFFRFTTGLRVKRLPAHKPALRRSGFQLTSSHQSMAQFITSELWNLPV
jgi:ubiquinone/menaquinone biosynthesis C-methylase UbiE